MENPGSITLRTVAKKTLLFLLVLFFLIDLRLFVLSPAAIVSATPADQSIGVAPDAHISIAFENPMNRSSLTSATLQLLDGGQPVPARISYNAVSNTATIDASNPLAYGEKYTVAVIGGPEGVKSAHFNRNLPSDFSFTFTTAASPLTGPGGPILVINSASKPFSTYYAEILRAEGLNEFATADIATVTPGLLSGYRLVIVGEIPVTDQQASTLENFVRGGGKLIAMRPDAKLDELLGLRASGQSVSDEYLKIDNTLPTGAGLVNTPIQYHGAADLNQLDGATALATLYSTNDSSLPNPAVSLREVGNNGGEAAAFTYDLARSIIQTRQGNPAWSRQHRDDQLVGRSDDQLLGPARPAWMDRSKIAIPQADQQQRLLANLIEQMMLPIMPLPRFWYLPNGAKAMLIMSGDDHDSGGVFGRWHNYTAHGTSGGMPITATSYVFPGHNLPDRIFAPLASRGFEVALHVDVTSSAIFGSPADVPVDWSSYAELDSIYSHQLAIFGSEYPSIPSPTTNRTHGVVWSDFDSQPRVEFSHGIRMDANYYYWPPTWVNDRPGMFTGSGMPMRFTTMDGRMIDVFQESTLITDESGQTEPYFVDALLDAATGPEENFGAFAINAHTDDVDSPTADAVIVSAQAHHVPVVDMAYLLHFTDGRDNSSFDAIQWDRDAKRLTFALSMAAGAEGVQAMVPLRTSEGDAVASISIDGKPVEFTRELLAGIYYARFDAVAGTVAVQYGPGGAELEMTAQSPVPGAEGVAIDGAASATFDRAIDSGTLSFNLRDFNGAMIPATVVYDSAKLTATLTPGGVLRSGFPYTAVISALDDQDGAPMARAWTFTTASPDLGQGSYRFWKTSSIPICQHAADGQSLELGVQFTSDVPGMVTGISFFKDAANTGTHVGRVWRDGKLLASAVFSNETADGWQTVSFAEPVAIARGAVYVASYRCETGNYAYTRDYFDGHGMDSGPLHAPANSMASGGNGVFADSNRSAGNEIKHVRGMPDQTFGATNYWVDVEFVPTLPERLTTVPSTSP